MCPADTTHCYCQRRVSLVDTGLLAMIGPHDQPVGIDGNRKTKKVIVVHVRGRNFDRVGQPVAIFSFGNVDGTGFKVIYIVALRISDRREITVNGDGPAIVLVTSANQ